MPERFVMTPGPTEIPLRVLNAMIRPAISPGDPDFAAAMDETSEMLRTILGTRGSALFFPGSGRVAIEAAIMSSVDPGDRVLTVNGGVFGKWLGMTVECAEGVNVELKVDWRRAIDPDELRRKLQSERDIKLVCVVHNETSTGVVNPVAEIGRIVHEYGALYLVDTVSSAAGDWVRMDDWGIDLSCTGCYKCMNCPPGLAIVGVNEAAWEAMRRRSVRRSFSFDLYKWLEMWIPRDQGGLLLYGYRRHVVEPVPHITYALREALSMILEEGQQVRCARNALAGRAVRAAVAAMRLELYPTDAHDASNTLTTILNNTGIPGERIIDTMEREHGVLIGGGLEEVAGKILRIAHMGTTSDEMHILYTIEALEKTLRAHGWKIAPHTGLDAVRAVFDAG